MFSHYLNKSSLVTFVGKNFDASPPFITTSRTIVELINVCSGDVSKKTVSIDEAIALLQPIQDDVRSLNTLATAYYRKDDKETAISLFEQAAEAGDKAAILNLKNIRENY